MNSKIRPTNKRNRPANSEIHPAKLKKNQGCSKCSPLPHLLISLNGGFPNGVVTQPFVPALLLYS